MNLSHLYYFKKLADVGHYTKAAQELFIAQPTLSAAVSQLEKELGVPLFQKHTRAVHLTPYGQDFYRYVSIALESLDKGIDLVEQRAGIRRVTVRLGAIYAIQDTEWSMGIKRFRDMQERAITLDIRQDRTSTLLRDLRDGRYDAVFAGLPSDDANVISAPYRSFNLILAVNKNHPLAGRESISLEQLRPYHLLTYAKSSSVHGDLVELLQRHGLSPDMAYSDSITMCALVSADPSNVALVVDSFILKSFDELSLVRIENVPQAFHHIYLCYRNDEYSPDIVKRFVQFFLRNAPDANRGRGRGADAGASGIVGG